MIDTPAKIIEALSTLNEATLDDWFGYIEDLKYFNVDVDRLENIIKLVFKAKKVDDLLAYYIEYGLSDGFWKSEFNSEEGAKFRVYKEILLAFNNKQLTFYPVGKIDKNGELYFFDQPYRHGNKAFQNLIDRLNNQHTQRIKEDLDTSTGIPIEYLKSLTDWEKNVPFWKNISLQNS